MLHRFAVLIAGIALTAGSVAPAQVAPVSVQTSVPSTALDDVPSPATPPITPSPDAASITEPAMVELKPAIQPAASLAEKVAEMRGSDAGSRELECLAAGVYFEAKSEPLAGQLAVGQVIANRANSRGRFPSSYCGVLFQRGQFSFVRGDRWPAVNKSGAQWKNAVAIARIVDADLHDSSIGRALFFHARRVSPGWRLTRVASVGNHVFYR
ncbi:cell wall hydrolase [uncultured Sphingomonas sp.]|uniref:cell wall hydrolase n=1 Tax=uncultured Sphingomonas sp. TaxID=158754 RepID=UPI0025F268EB|nr:cell wall hydrolase [uncultured Sphingomonas sp.]